MKEQLKDIHPFIINETIFYIQVIIILIIIIIALILLFRFSAKKIIAYNLQKKYIKELKLLTWDDAKDTTLKIQIIVEKLSLTNESDKIYKDLLLNLKMYKYIKYAPIVDDKTIIKYNLFIKELEDEQF